jgi:hypothetical protein
MVPGPGRIHLVSSLYGPGTMICWYLTTLSVLLSWILHPRKSTSGSIDADLLAVLTLPIAATVHLSLLIHSKISAAQLPNCTTGFRLVAAIQAPLAVVETFQIFSVLMLAVALRAYCVRRAILVGVIGLACFGIGYYTTVIHRSIRLEVIFPGTDIPCTLTLA